MYLFIYRNIGLTGVRT